LSDKNKLAFPEPGAGDRIYVFLLGSMTGASAIANVHGIPLPDLSNLLEKAIPVPYQKRLMDHLRRLTDEVNALRLSADDLKNNAAFVTAFLDMLEAATLTENIDLLGYYRNVVLNTTQPKSPDEDTQRIFRQLTRRFGSWHFRLLKFFGEEKWYTELGFADDLENLEPEEALSRLPQKFNELETRGTFVNLVVSELSDARLIILPEVRLDKRDMIYTTSEINPAIISDLGKQFIDFVIHSPLDIPPHLRVGYRR